MVDEIIIAAIFAIGFVYGVVEVFPIYNTNEKPTLEQLKFTLAVTVFCLLCEISLYVAIFMDSQARIYIVSITSIIVGAFHEKVVEKLKKLC